MSGDSVVMIGLKRRLKITSVFQARCKILTLYKKATSYSLVNFRVSKDYVASPLNVKEADFSMLFAAKDGIVQFACRWQGVGTHP